MRAGFLLALAAAFVLGGGAASPPFISAGNSISAAPAYLPYAPAPATLPPLSSPLPPPLPPPRSPAPSPAADEMPLLPTPRRGSAGAMPTIQSNPSPPDPDMFGPTTPLDPYDSSEAAAVVPSAAVAPPVASAALCVFLVLRTSLLLSFSSLDMLI